MMSHRLTAGATVGGMRKPSLLPKLRRAGSTDRTSVDARRPSAARSSSADPPRATLGARLSREASATKLPLNRRSRSQQNDNRGYGSHVPMTPLMTSKNSRSTTTPRTPSEDRAAHSWQMSIDRALACVTIKDNRPIQTIVWQRAMQARVQELLGARGADGGGSILTRPLSIAHFVNATSTLLHSLVRDSKLNNDNYILKIPHTVKRLLYPGNVSKSWLRTVNTLHAFPQALALMGYLTDLVLRVESPMQDEELYLEKDELACLRREYLNKSWIRFQEPDSVYDDLNEEYRERLTLLLGDDEKKIDDLQQIVTEQQLCLEDAAEAAARADECRRTECRAGLLAGLRAERAARVATRGAVDAGRAKLRALTEDLRSLETEIERANIESQKLRNEIENQTMTVVERTKLLEEVDYANRVIDSKRVLAQQISKMVLSKETELALWQKKTLDSCVEYKQGLIHLSAAYPNIMQHAIDEKELMGEKCASAVMSALEELKCKHAELLQQATARERERQTDKRRRVNKLTELRAALAEIRSNVDREQAAAEVEREREATEAASWAGERREITVRADKLRSKIDQHQTLSNQLLFWERQNDAWTNKLNSFKAYISSKQEEACKRLEEARRSRNKLVLDTVAMWNEKLDLVMPKAN